MCVYSIIPTDVETQPNRNALFFKISFIKSANKQDFEEQEIMWYLEIE